MGIVWYFAYYAKYNSGDWTHGPERLSNKPFCHKGLLEAHGWSQGTLKCISRSLPYTTDRVKPGFAEVWIIPKVVKVEGLLPFAQFLSFQPLLTPLSVHISKQSRSNSLSHIHKGSLTVHSSFPKELVSLGWVVYVRVTHCQYQISKSLVEVNQAIL